jgi:3-oxoacyl-[acyl-carrier-protein] synthase III
VSVVSPPFAPLDILGLAAILPQERLSLEQVFEQERATVDVQLAALTEPFRARLLNGLGIANVATFGHLLSRDAAEQAAHIALERAGIAPTALGLIIDYSTLATDCPRVWSLAHHLQGRLEASKALAVGTRGSGCAGLHLALLMAQGFLAANPSIDYALLVAADRAPDGGRCCLPVSIMSDAATALVVGRPSLGAQRRGRLHAVVVQQLGNLAELLVVEPTPCRMRIDSGAFEKQVLPVHFVMLHRLLTRAMRLAKLDTKDIAAYVYPNTTGLDRQSIARGFKLAETQFAGPGPSNLGHAFANDLVINAESLFQTPPQSSSIHSAWLAAGSGFTWGAAIVEVNV